MQNPKKSAAPHANVLFKKHVAIFVSLEIFAHYIQSKILQNNSVILVSDGKKVMTEKVMAEKVMTMNLVWRIANIIEILIVFVRDIILEMIILISTCVVLVCVTWVVYFYYPWFARRLGYSELLSQPLVYEYWKIADARCESTVSILGYNGDGSLRKRWVYLKRSIESVQVEWNANFVSFVFHMKLGSNVRFEVNYLKGNMPTFLKDYDLRHIMDLGEEFMELNYNSVIRVMQYSMENPAH
jgi:hypothetical protein